MCTVLLPPGGYTIAFNNISYHITNVMPEKDGEDQQDISCENELLRWVKDDTVILYKK